MDVEQARDEGSKERKQTFFCFPQRFAPHPLDSCRTLHDEHKLKLRQQSHTEIEQRRDGCRWHAILASRGFDATKHYGYEPSKPVPKPSAAFVAVGERYHNRPSPIPRPVQSTTLASQPPAKTHTNARLLPPGKSEDSANPPVPRDEVDAAASAIATPCSSLPALAEAEYSASVVRAIADPFKVIPEVSWIFTTA